MSSKFVVARVLNDAGFYRPRAYCLDDVEVYPAVLDTPSEAKAIAQSLENWSETTNIGMRIRVIIEAETALQAQRFAEARFDEVLDVLDFTGTGLSRFAFLNAGYTRDLGSGEVVARDLLPEFGPHPCFFIMTEKYPPLDVGQYLLSRPRTDLGTRLIRSVHWTRKARWERDYQLRVLFRWFALEAIWMLMRDEDVVPRVMWGLGFPTGGAVPLVQRSLLSRLASHARYRAWRTQILKRFRDIRKFRNDSLHAGLRRHDIPTAELERFEQLLRLACPRVQSMALRGVIAKLETAQQLLEYLPLIFEQNPNLVNDIHNTVLYMLEHPT